MSTVGTIPALPPLGVLEQEWLRRKQHSQQQSQVRQYWDNRAGFVRKGFLWRRHEAPSSAQLDILTRLVEHKRVATRGPHGFGKTTTAAWAVLWFANTRDGEDWKIPTTASSWRQLSKFLWPEIHKWARRLNWELLGRPPYTRNELLGLSLKLRTGEAFAAASDVPDLIEGAHADHLLYVFDEAKIIPAATFDAAEGAFSGGGLGSQEALALASSTPGDPSGRFYDIHARKPGYEDWDVRHVSLAESIASGRISPTWAAQRKRQWGETSPIYLNRTLGEFAANDVDSVIPLAWIEAAIERWKEWRDSEESLLLELTAVGVDIGRGGDPSVLALRDEDTLVEFRRTTVPDIMAPVGMVGGVLRRYGGTAVIDIIGLGAGCYDRLREVREVEMEKGLTVEWQVLPFCASATKMVAKLRDRSGELGFVNLRAAAYWRFRELLDPAYHSTLRLPDDDLLIGDLLATQYKITSAGIQIIPKEKIKEKLGRSPDTADAAVQAYALELLAGEQDVWGGTMGEEEREPLMELMRKDGGMYFPTAEPVFGESHGGLF